MRNMELALIVTSVVSIALATAMAIVAWRMARAERLRSAARVAALSAELQDVEVVRDQAAAVGIRGDSSRLRQVVRKPADIDNLELRPGFGAVSPPAEIFRTGTQDGSASRLASVVAVGTFAVAAALALVVATSRGGPSLVDPAAVQNPAPSAPGEPVPLELAALAHVRDGDRLVIRGTVRNPANGAKVDRIEAVVSLFDRDGGFLGSDAAAVDVASLMPGQESRFVVEMAHGAEAGRYRVSFKTGDRVVPHVDRRDAGIAATTGDKQP
jgi:hypothetical protein